MKLNTAFFLSIGQLAAAGRTLSSRAGVETECFALDAVNETNNTFNSYGLCSDACADAGHSVFAVRGPGCVCLDSLPSDDTKVDSSECDELCPGFAAETCGGRDGYYSVGTINAASFNSSNTTTTTSTSPATVSSAAPATANTSSSNVPSNSTSSVTPSSGSASGSPTASASPTIASSSAAAATIGTGLTVVSSMSLACAVAALISLV